MASAWFAKKKKKKKERKHDGANIRLKINLNASYRHKYHINSLVILKFNLCHKCGLKISIRKVMKKGKRFYDGCVVQISAADLSEQTKA